MGTLQIDILGTSFTITAKEDTEYLQKLLAYYSQVAKQIETTEITQDNIQTAILTGIMLCDELYKEKYRLHKIKKQVNTEALAEAEKITLKMMGNIDKVLETNNDVQNLG